MPHHFTITLCLELLLHLAAAVGAVPPRPKSSIFLCLCRPTLQGEVSDIPEKSPALAQHFCQSGARWACAVHVWLSPFPLMPTPIICPYKICLKGSCQGRWSSLARHESLILLGSFTWQHELCFGKARSKSVRQQPVGVPLRVGAGCGDLSALTAARAEVQLC